MLIIRIRGLVQGVGFRPFVWQLAKQLGINGSVSNDSEGVLIQAQAADACLRQFCEQLQQRIPPLARIDEIICTPLHTFAQVDDFTITKSTHTGKHMPSIAPDAAICPTCRDELNAPGSRYFAYPFTSCSHCGPRLSILKTPPFDRNNSSMASFPMCPQCQAEYRDPQQRRFHAQTQSCALCGPQLWLENQQGRTLAKGDDVIADVAARLQAGAIVAIKGIGGFHLAVDASHEAAVARLRQRKQRAHKPFALMAANIASIGDYAEINDREAALLQSPAAPIVLLRQKPNAQQLAKNIAPKQTQLGFMLPYSALHQLLLTKLTTPIVLTSGNRSQQPPCINNHEARQQLSDIADVLLLHDRDILHRLDDSVAMISAGHPRLLRRARGFAPATIALHASFHHTNTVLAMGSELKNTFCLLADGQALLSQHIGDLEHAQCHDDYLAALSIYRQMHDTPLDCIAVDQHPDYFSTQYGQQLAIEMTLPVQSIQHHHAHIAAVMAEQQLPINHPPVLGIALDGLGLGDDGTLWGGEFLYADFCHVRRIACFQPTSMPGATQAIREPWRNTFAHFKSIGWQQLSQDFADCDIICFLQAQPQAILHQMIERKLNSPISSSCGRLFDAVAAALNICRTAISYEGQAAIELEALAQSCFADEQQHYPYHINTHATPTMIHWHPMWLALLKDLQQGIDTARIAARFHRTIIAAMVHVTLQLKKHYPLKTIVLCGGVWQNRLLFETASQAFEAQGLSVLSAQLTPLNDGGLSLGQAAIAAARMEKIHD